MEPLNYLNRTHDLTPTILDEIQPYLAKDAFDALPMPKEGFSQKRIRILESHKVLIRVARDDEQKGDLMLRLENMKIAREIIKNNNFLQIKVPKAILNANYMIEKLLPVHDGLFATMAYYIQNSYFFESAVIEFTKFLQLTNLSDIVGGNTWTPSNWPQGLPRYDNIKLYEKTKNDITKYQIGLVDLERFEAQPKAKNHMIDVAKQAIYLFPYQYDVILETCQKIEPFSLESIEILESCKKKAFESIRNSYHKHHEFFHSKSLLVSDPVTRFINSPLAHAELIDKMSKELFRVHLATPSTWYHVETKNTSLTKYKPWEIQEPDSAIVQLKILGQDPKKTLKYCEKKIFYPMLYKTCQHVQKMIDETRNQNFESKYTIMSARTMSWNRKTSKEKHSCLVSDPSRLTAKKISFIKSGLRKPIHPYFSDMIVKNELKRGELNLLITRIMVNLLKQKDFWAEVFESDKLVTVFF